MSFDTVHAFALSLYISQMNETMQNLDMLYLTSIQCVFKIQLCIYRGSYRVFLNYYCFYLALLKVTKARVFQGSNFVPHTGLEEFSHSCPLPGPAKCWYTYAMFQPITNHTLFSQPCRDWGFRLLSSFSLSNKPVPLSQSCFFLCAAHFSLGHGWQE